MADPLQEVLLAESRARRRPVLMPGPFESYRSEERLAYPKSRKPVDVIGAWALNNFPRETADLIDQLAKEWMKRKVSALLNAQLPSEGGMLKDPPANWGVLPRFIYPPTLMVPQSVPGETLYPLSNVPGPGYVRPIEHELSETVQRNGRWENISGLTRQRLLPLWPFEQYWYRTLEDAVGAAQQRSRQWDRLPADHEHFQIPPKDFPY